MLISFLHSYVQKVQSVAPEQGGRTCLQRRISLDVLGAFDDSKVGEAKLICRLYQAHSIVSHLQQHVTNPHWRRVFTDGHLHRTEASAHFQHNVTSDKGLVSQKKSFAQTSKRQVSTRQNVPERPMPALQCTTTGPWSEFRQPDSRTLNRKLRKEAGDSGTPKSGQVV